MDYEKAFARKVRMARMERGMSQSVLAATLANYGVKAYMSTIAKIEAGDRSIRLNEAMALAEALNIGLPMESPEESRADAERELRELKQEIRKLLD